jgi:hypothetical protein
MIFRSCGASALAVLACFCVLAGCDDAPPEQPAAGAKSSEAPAGPKLASLPGDMVAAVSAGKTATSIGVHFALRGTPTVGLPLPVEIAIVPHRKFATLRAQFEIGSGLKLTAGGALEPKIDAAVESVIKHELTLLPETEGLFMVSAIVESEGGEGNVSRVFSIPIIVGPARRAAAEAQPAPPPPEAAPATR